MNAVLWKWEAEAWKIAEKLSVSSSLFSRGVVSLSRPGQRSRLMRRRWRLCAFTTSPLHLFEAHVLRASGAGGDNGVGRQLHALHPRIYSQIWMTRIKDGVNQSLLGFAMHSTPAAYRVANLKACLANSMTFADGKSSALSLKDKSGTNPLNLKEKRSRSLLLRLLNTAPSVNKYKHQLQQTEVCPLTSPTPTPMSFSV